MKLFKKIIVDVMLVTGFSGVVYGIYEIYNPASYIVGGVMLLLAFTPKSNNRTKGRE
jgi:hypothetical protein